MNFLFWNTNGRDVADLLGGAVRQHDVDIIVLAESKMPWDRLAASLNIGQASLYRPTPTLGEQGNKLTLITRLAEQSISPVADFPGLSFRAIRPPTGPMFTLGMAHLRSKLFQQDIDQVLASTAVAGYIKDAEALTGHRHTLLVGDLNMNPFETGIVGAAGLHAVGVRSMARGVSRVIAEREYHFFYNPMWSHFGDRTDGPPGTYFYRSGRQVEYFWHMFDQVLVRPDLLSYFDDASLRILTSINGISLLTAAGVPSRTVGSDHLPIMFGLRMEGL